MENEQMKQRYVGVILRKGDRVYLQRRDNKPGLAYSGMLAIFGGGIEVTDKTDLDAALREMNEETNLNLLASDLNYFQTLQLPADVPASVLAREFVVYVAEIENEDFEVYEGQGSESFDLEQIQDMISRLELGQGARLVLAELIRKENEDQ